MTHIPLVDSMCGEEKQVPACPSHILFYLDFLISLQEQTNSLSACQPQEVSVVCNPGILCDTKGLSGTQGQALELPSQGRALGTLQSSGIKVAFSSCASWEHIQLPITETGRGQIVKI